MEQYGGGANSKQQKYLIRISDVSFTNQSLSNVNKTKWLFAYGIWDLEVVDIVSMLQTVERRTCML